MDIERRMLEELQRLLNNIKRNRDEFGKGYFGEREEMDAYIIKKSFTEIVTGKKVVTDNWRLSLVLTLDE